MTGENKISKMERGGKVVTKDNGKAKDFCAFSLKNLVRRSIISRRILD